MPVTVYTAHKDRIPSDMATQVLNICPGGPWSPSPLGCSFEVILAVPESLRYVPDADPSEEFGVLRDKAWNAYAEGYRVHLRGMYKRGRAAFEALIGEWPRVYVVDDASDPRRAFRTVLREVLVKLGARDGGEIGAPQATQAVQAEPQEPALTPEKRRAATEEVLALGLEGGVR